MEDEENHLKVNGKRKYKDPQEMKKLINEYFNNCNESKLPYTVSGLALHLGLSRKSLLEYQKKYGTEFGEVVEEAKTRIEAFVETCLFKPKIATGVIFNLKNNFGWADKQEVEHSGDVNVKLEDLI